MAGFRKAKAEQAALKMGLYGPAGKGKSFTSLLIAEGLANLTKKRIAYVDTEHGTDFYAKDVAERRIHPKAFDFDAIYTKSLSEVIASVRDLNPEEHSVIVIDSVSHLWESAKLAFSGRLTSIGTIPMSGWANIKKPYKDLVNLLLSSPFHVIFCGRQGNDFQEDDDGDLKMVGYKMKAEGETAYEPHILIRMEAVRVKDGRETISAVVEKDRTGILSGRSIQLWPAPESAKADTYTFDQLVKPMLHLLGGTQARMQSDDETAAKDAEAMATNEAQRQEDSQSYLEDFKARFQLAKTVVEVEAVSKSITAEIKKSMVTSHVAELRNVYRDAMNRASGKRTTVPAGEE